MDQEKFYKNVILIEKYFTSMTCESRSVLQYRNLDQELFYKYKIYFEKCFMKMKYELGIILQL